MASPWEHLGADDDARFDRLRAIVRAFYARVVGDPMIGFFFTGKDVGRLVEHETRFTARLLGGPASYAGRPMRAAHAERPVFSGHFDRRQQILREVLAAEAAPPEVARAWLEHNERLRDQIAPPRR